MQPQFSNKKKTGQLGDATFSLQNFTQKFPLFDASSLNASDVNQFFSNKYNYRNRKRPFHLLREKKKSHFPLFEDLKRKRVGWCQTEEKEDLISDSLDHLRQGWTPGVKKTHDKKFGSLDKRTFQFYKRFRMHTLRELPIDRLTAQVLRYKMARYTYGRYQTSAAIIMRTKAAQGLQSLL